MSIDEPPSAMATVHPTAIVDPGAEIGDLLDNLDDEDPRSVFRNLDPDRFYPVYGDDSTTIDEDGLGSVDLTEGGTLYRIAVQVASDDWPASLNFTVYSGTGSGTGSISLPGMISTPTIYGVNFTSFSGSVDFTDVGAIVLDIGTTYEVTDLQFDFIESAIPEPATVGLLAIGALMLVRRKR